MPLNIFRCDEKCGLGETVGSLRRIDGTLEPGMKVIVEGAHYVTDGEKVRTIDEGLASR